MAMKYGYDSVEEYKNGAQKKFSLLSGWKGLSKTLLSYALALMCFSEVSQIAVNSGQSKFL